MDSTGTDDRLLSTLGGAMAIGGALMEFVGNALHPRSTDYYGNPAAWLDNATQSAVWFPSHALILLGAILLIGGFVGLSRSLVGRPGHGVGQLGLANALVGLTLIIVTAAIDGLAVAKLDEVWNFGLAPIFFGVAILLGKTYAAWLGWAGILIGSSVVLNALLAMFGVATEFLDAYVWTVVASLFVIWVFAIGLLLWRRA